MTMMTCKVRVYIIYQETVACDIIIPTYNYTCMYNDLMILEGHTQTLYYIVV